MTKVVTTREDLKYILEQQKRDLEENIQLRDRFFSILQSAKTLRVKERVLDTLVELKGTENLLKSDIENITDLLNLAVLDITIIDE